MAKNIKDWMKYPESTSIWLLEDHEVVVSRVTVGILVSDINQLYLESQWMGPESDYHTKAGFAERVREIQRHIIALQRSTHHEEYKGAKEPL